MKKTKIIIACVLALTMAGLFTGCSSTPSESEALIKAKKMSADDLKKSCQSIDYKTLKNNPDENTDKLIKVEVRIEQELDGSYRAYAGNPGNSPDNWYEDEYILEDKSKDGLKLSEGEKVTAYGVSNGLAKVERALTSENDELPDIAVVATGDLESVNAINTMVQGIQWNKSTDEFGDISYTAVVENTTGYKFDNFSIDVKFLDSNGISIGDDTAYAENWEPGQKVKFEITYVQEGTAKLQVADFDYYSNN